MKFYNTLTRQKEVFETLKPNEVSMYVCGPTVYNYIHIGNARSTVAFDTIRRYLEYKGYTVNYVSNFTDVDDKIIKAGQQLSLTPQEVADKFIAAFYKDIDLLNVKRATRNPRVMENMDDIIVFIEALITKGFAYEANGDVYYRTQHFEKYGQLSGQSLSDLSLGASERLADEDQEKKENLLDFALWKKAKEGEISWDSPWGFGRPGWHIECSVMATKYLGATIDIHAGGQDLIFPHHENEIAQSQACTGEVFARYWLHNGFVTFDGEKMSKSLGNFVLVHELLEKVDPQVVRFLLSSAHYRHPLAFSQEIIEEATNNLEKIKNTYRQLIHRLKTAKDTNNETDDEMKQACEDYQNQFIEAMDDDVNTPNGLMVIYQFVKTINIYTEQVEVNRFVIEELAKTLREIMTIFGVVLEEETLIDETIQALIDERAQARANKDFKRSDEIRDYLKEQGILLDDTPQGTRYKRV